MTDNTDGGQPSGTVGQPTQPVSASAGDKQHSSVESVDRLEAALRELQGQVRALQGEKDRGVHEVKGQVQTLMKQLEWVERAKARGLSLDEIEEQLELKALLQGNKQGNSPTGSPVAAAGSPAQVAGIDTQALLSNLGLNANDAEVIQALRDGDFGAQLGKLASLSAAKKAQQPAREPNPAALMPSVGGQSVPVENLETISAELEQELAKPIKDMKRIRELAAKQKALLPQK